MPKIGLFSSLNPCFAITFFIYELWNLQNQALLLYIDTYKTLE